MKTLLKTDISSTTIIIRLMVGLVFLSEGIQKFLFAEKLGAGRFAKIGFSNSEFIGAFVGYSEITCGMLVLLGLLTRLATMPLLCIMLVAMATTKADTFANDGFWAMMHASRTDWAMLLGCIFLLIRGGGRWSFDSKIGGKWKS
jgi:putative oxidoreductase